MYRNSYYYDYAESSHMSGSEIVFVVVLIGGFIVWFYSLIDILRHEFTNSNKLVWLIVIFVLNILGSILYLFIGKKQRLGVLQKTIKEKKSEKHYREDDYWTQKIKDTAQEDKEI